MNREEAEKLLAALIFGDLDEASKTDLTAYLQTDDELRERLADMRMAVKVASDALQHGPDPVLGKKRLKRLARLARQRSGSRRSAVFTVRYMAAAAAILAVVLLPSFLIFKGTDRSQPAYSLQSFQPADSLEPGIDMGGGYSFNENDKHNLEFTGGTSPGEGMAALPIVLPKPMFVGTPTNAPVKLKPASDQNGSVEGYYETAGGGVWNSYRGSSKMAEAIPGSGSVTTEESLEGKKQFAKATRREGIYDYDSVDSIQEYSRQRPVGKGVKLSDGHLTLDGDADEIVSEQITVSDKNGPVERPHYYNAPMDAVADESFSGDVKRNWDYDGGPGGGQYKLKPDPVTGIQMHGTTVLPADEIDRRMESSVVAGDVDHWRSVQDAKMQAAAGKPRPEPAKIPTSATTPKPLQPPLVVASDRSEESEPKSRTEDWVREMVTTNTESKAAESLRKLPAGNKNDADGKKFNGSPGVKYRISSGDIGEPFSTVHDEIIVDRRGKDMVSEEAKKGQISSLELSDFEGIAHDNIYTGPSISNRIIPHNTLENADSVLINDTEGSIELQKIGNESIKKESSATRPETGFYTVIQIMNGDPITLYTDEVISPEDLKLIKEELSTPPISCKLEVHLVDEQGMASINEDIESSGEKRAKDAEVRTRFRANFEEGAPLGVGNSEVPVGEDETDLPLASRFKSVPVNPWVMTERDPLSTFALDVDTASYTLSRRYIYGGFLPPAGAVRMEEFVNYFNYHYPQRTDRTFTVHAEAAPSPFADKGKNLTLLKIGVKARTIGRDQRKAAHLILVVDTSASMGKPDRLPLVQQALNLLIDRLSAADRVTLITCANQAHLHLEATSVRQRDRIRRAINAMQPSGPTNLLAGLKLGYAAARRSFAAKQINHVVLCSDGVANVGQTEADAVLKAVAADRKQGITITCVGVGYGSYNDAFLESLANRGDGSYVFLDSARQAQRVFVEQLAATLHTVAKDARIQVSFNPDRVRRYRLIGYENRDIEDKRFRDDTVDAGEVGSGQCSTALYELELTGQRSADQREGLGTVFVRYRCADTGRMEEISCRLKSAIVQRRKVESSPRFFLAAAAARFAEILRQSEHARQGSLTDVLAVAEKVSLALPLDRDVRELAELIRKAEHLPRSQ